MYYPRFTKVIVDYFMAKDQGIPRRNKMFWHYARDDFMFTIVRVISKHQDMQVYGAILPQHLTNQAMLESEAYMTYRAYATSEKVPKPKTIKKKADYESSPKTKSTQASKGKRITTLANGDKPAKKKQSASKSKGLTVLSEVALTEAQQMKIAIERSKIQTHSSHASGIGDGVDIQSKVPDKQQQNISSTNEGAGDKPEVLDVPEYRSEKDEEDEELYGDLNLNLDRRDAEMTDAQNNQEIEELNVTLTTEPLVVQQQSSSVSSDLVSKFINPSPDTGIDSILNPNVQSDIPVNVSVSATTETPSSDTIIPQPPIPIIQPQQQTHDSTTTTTTTFPKEISNFASLFGFKRRVSSLEIEISELKPTNQFTKVLSSISGIVDNYLASRMKDAVNIDSNIKAIIKDQVKAQVSKIMPKVEKYVTKSLGAEVLAISSNQPQTSYAAAASLSEFELKKILIDKIKENKSMNRSDIQKNLYNTLIESYNSEEDLFASYGDVVTLKRGRDDQAKDEEPFVGSNRGTKRRSSGKEELSKEATQKESKSTSSSKGASRSQPKSSSKSAQAEEHGPRVDDLEELLHQEFNTGNDDVSPTKLLEVYGVRHKLSMTSMPTEEHIIGDQNFRDSMDMLPKTDEDFQKMSTQGDDLDQCMEYSGADDQLLTGYKESILPKTSDAKTLKICYFFLVQDKMDSMHSTLSMYYDYDAHVKGELLVMMKNSQSRFLTEFEGLLQPNRANDDMITGYLKMEVKRRSIKDKEFQRSFRHLDIERLSRSDEVLKLKNFKKDATLKLFKSTNQERYEHVDPEVTSSQDGKVYKMAKRDYAWLMISRCSRSHFHIQNKGTSSNPKSMIITSQVND
ncbi:hypothetical protein Tco_0232659 [Tanacetum coccineum]